ncbi:hypothetical protein G7Y89_g11479 [Cudoniella acicularis]|uniref:Zn(2)-C6 fungal-type domain-containing protein n=1 Tax=Cudoniella acicularis TaxID=354080 RepID=A0A8H4RD59_9HELO|nr:hypothetical protein G7Y89_g11479 [Cudoniella acicularis]
MSPATQHSRQKSCIPCANGKRRCDMALPSCSRCLSKSIPCEYKSNKHTVAAQRAQNNTETPSDKSSDFYSTAPTSDVAENINRESPHTMLLDPEMPLELPSLGINPTPDNGMLLDDFLQVYDNRFLNDPHSIGVMDRERIRYCVRQLRTLPEKFVKQGRNAFIHPQTFQYMTPQSLQDALCVAALYMQKNEFNEALIWEIISTKVNQLLDPRGSWSISDNLASLQALIIYQIIRLFDGEVRPRSDAEQQEATLIAWTDHLVQRTGINTSSGSVVPSSWESWVFEEGTCRTIIISKMVQAMFAIQKQGFCTLVPAVTELSFTAQRALWEAPTQQHWKKALAERPSLHVPCMDFTEILLTGTWNDVEDLAMLMLVTYKGIDEVNEWIVKSENGVLLE